MTGACPCTQIFTLGAEHQKSDPHACLPCHHSRHQGFIFKLHCLRLPCHLATPFRRNYFSTLLLFLMRNEFSGYRDCCHPGAQCFVTFSDDLGEEDEPECNEGPTFCSTGAFQVTPKLGPLTTRQDALNELTSFLMSQFSHLAIGDDIMTSMTTEVTGHPVRNVSAPSARSSVYETGRWSHTHFPRAGVAAHPLRAFGSNPSSRGYSSRCEGRRIEVLILPQVIQTHGPRLLWSTLLLGFPNLSGKYLPAL